MRSWSGDAALDGALAESSPAAAQPRAQPPTSAAAAVVLSSLQVRGVRGIAEASSRTVEPGPGLTLVIGRNGSGKSSFAEAAELALTGTCKRWEKKSVEWKAGWRNLHAKHAPLIRCGFSLEGVGETKVTLRWKDGGEFEAMERTVTLRGEAVDWAGLGWDASVQTHRPFLSYAELGALVEKPSGLYDQLEGILGLEAVASARTRLSARKKTMSKALKQCDERRKELVEQLSGLEDPRAADCGALLAGRKAPDLKALSRILTGSDEGAGAETIAALQGITQLRAPDVDRVGALVDALRGAIEAHESATTAQAAQASALVRVLGQALELTQAAGHDETCPVCSAPLSERWRAEAERRAAEAKALARGLAQSQLALQQAVADLRAQIRGVPPALTRAVEGLDVESLRTRWQAWAEAPTEPRALAEHAEQRVLELADATRTLQAEAKALRDHLADAWAPVGEALGAWIGAARAVEPARPKVAALKKAEAWMKTVEGTLRAQRFEPIRARAMEVWGMLKQSSSVSLDSLELAGTATRRRVELKVSVDDQDSVALSVMSKGELNALGLSLFLPRMEQPGSPFRFVVVDDPVQAMDLDKVDGLARVLASVAKTRQVVVFTHDNRLPEAVERLRSDARVVEVHRRAQSEVEAREGQQTSDRFFDDAFAVMNSERELGPAVVGDLVPAFCRDGIEAACRRRVQRDRLGRGDPHETVARALAEASTTQQLMALALALLSDGSKGSEVYARLENGVGRTCRIGSTPSTMTPGDLRCPRHVW
ncbi:MAG: AAA family ATPase [Myxococcota bacterium]